MSKHRAKAFYATAIIMIFTALYATNAYSQYNGECWALDYLNAIKISGNKVSKFPGFSQPLSISINPNDGSVWVADSDAIRVKKLSSAGKELFIIDKGFSEQPISVAVDPKDSSCWAATASNLFKFSAEGKQIMTKAGFNEPVLAVNPKNSECWIADSNNARIVRLSQDGSQLGVYTIDGITQPKSISINPEDGTLWIMDPFTLTVAKISPDGNVLKKTSVSPPGGATMATSITASSDGGCWVAIIVDFTQPNKDIVVKLSTDGKQTASIAGFAMPSTVCFDPKDKGCWVADSNNGQIVKLSATGQKILNLQGFGQPKAVIVVFPVKK
jgi:DNA-binding beta-propeller fold protein YncE